MKALRRFMKRLTASVLGRGNDDRVQEELAEHLRLLTEQRVRAGLPPDEARRQARLTLGASDALTEACRDEQRVRWLEDLGTDIRYGVRMLLRNRGFAAVAVVTLALGIGANAAVFTVAYTLLAKPLPGVDTDRVVLVRETNPERGWTSVAVAPPNFIDWRAENRSFERMAAYGFTSYNFSGSEAPERLRGVMATEGFLEILGGTPVLGRGFRPEEFEAGQDRVVILSHGLWRRAFAESPSVIGRTIALSGQSYAIVGVMHEGWRFGGRDLALFAPRVFSEAERQARGAHDLNVIAEMKPSVQVEQARAEMAALAARLQERYPDTNDGWGTAVTSLRDAVAGNFRPVLLILLGTVALVLLIACANVANMLLARAADRAREMAVRTALGAARTRIVRQLLTESAVLSIAGGVFGVLIAHWGTSSLVRAYPDILPRASDIRVDGVVLVFAAALSLVTAAVFGVAPALASSRTRLSESLRDGGWSRTRGAVRRSVSHALIVGQVAVAVIVVAGAGLCLRSVLQLTRVEPGFDVERRLGVATILPRATYEQPAATTAFYARACERLRALPGVQSVALTSTIPIGGGGRSYAVQFEGRPTDRGVSALYYLVGPDYFSVMGIPVLRGRSFADTDRDGAPRVAIVNDEFVRVHYPNEDPIGKRIRMGRDGDVVREIVGVVGGVKHYGLRDAPEAQMYEPFQQSPITDMNFVLKTATDPSGLIAAVRGAIQSVDPDQPVARAEALESMLARSTMLSRVQTALLSGLAGIAVSLAAIGLYGVLAYTVAQRRREIGIRIALGAQAGSVMHLISGQAMRVTGAGLVIGAIGWALLARTLSRTLEPMLFQVTLFDLSTLAVVFLILIVVTVAAAVVPARRAIHTDPIDVLRIG